MQVLKNFDKLFPGSCDLLFSNYFVQQNLLSLIDILIFISYFNLMLQNPCLSTHRYQYQTFATTSKGLI